MDCFTLREKSNSDFYVETFVSSLSNHEHRALIDILRCNLGEVRKVHVISRFFAIDMLDAKQIVDSFTRYHK